MKSQYGKTGLKVDFDSILDWITSNTYDATHIGGLTGLPEWCVSAEGILTHLKDQVGFTDEEMRKAFDAARVRVHGPNVEGGR